MFVFFIQSEEMKKLLGNVGEIHTPKVNPNFRRIATPPPEPYSILDECDLESDQLLFSTTNIFNDKDAGTSFSCFFQDEFFVHTDFVEYNS